MIVKGAARAGPTQLGNYLMRLYASADKNEYTELLELQSPWANPETADRERAAAQLVRTFLDWQILAEGTQQGRDGLYHAQINPAATYVMTHEQWLRAADILGEELGLKDQQRAVVLHGGEDRPHIHVVWARTDIDTMKLHSDSYNYVAHEQASKRMELEFGHEFVPGKHAKRDRDKQPEFPRAEMTTDECQQAKRTGIDPADRKEQITALKESSDSPQAFMRALGEQGYILARGERGFVLVDEAGEIYSLSRQVSGVKPAELREFMKGIDPQTLPTVEQAAQLQQQIQDARKQAAEKPVAEKQAVEQQSQEKPAAEKQAERKDQITALKQASDSPQVFMRALGEQGYILARGERRDFVLVDAAGEVHSLARQIHGMKAADLREYMKGIDPENLPTAEQAAQLQQQIQDARKQAAQKQAAEQQSPEKPAAEKQAEPARPEPSQPAEQTKGLSLEEIQAIRKAVADRQAREAADMRQRQQSEYNHTRDILDHEMAEKLAHRDALQQAERARFARENAPATRVNRMIDAFHRRWNPKRIQKREAERKRRQREMEHRQKTERADYAAQLKHTRNTDLENLAERHAQQLRDHTRRTEEDLNRYIREQETARRLRAEIEERERQQELERTRHGPEWRPPPRAR